MKRLVLLVGAPGSGKSTIINSLGLADHTVSYDTIRKTLSCANISTGGSVRRIGGRADKIAREFTIEAARQRMSNGETVIVDNTNADPKARRVWTGLAREYGYQVSAIDAQGDLTDEELLARNASRQMIDRVPDADVVSMAAKVRHFVANTRIPVLTPAEFSESLIAPVLDFNDFERIIVIGDVQGCSTALNNLLDQVQVTDADHIVFCGDLFDRGVENAGVFETVTDLSAAHHIVRGNHDDHLTACISNTVGAGHFSVTRTSIREIVEAGHFARDITTLVNGMVPYVAFTFGGAEHWVTHGGVRSLGEKVDGGYRSGLMPEAYFIYGECSRERTYTSRGDYDTEIDVLLSEHHAETGVIHFHGHRGYGEGPNAHDGVYSLESDVEYDGGMLSAAVISMSGIEAVQVPNPVTAGPMRERRSVAARNEKEEKS